MNREGALAPSRHDARLNPGATANGSYRLAWLQRGEDGKSPLGARDVLLDIGGLCREEIGPPNG